MTPLFSIRLTAKATAKIQEAIATGASPGANDIMRKAVDVGLHELMMVAQRERFTGGGPFPVADKRLGVQSGRLRRDMHAEAAVFTATGIRGRIGSIVEYFGPHEMGFQGEVQVPAHKRERRTVKRRKQTIARRGRAVTIRANQFSLLEQSVRAHTRKVNIPKREPLATAIREHSFRVMNAALVTGYNSILKSITP